MAGPARTIAARARAASALSAGVDPVQHSKTGIPVAPRSHALPPANSFAACSQTDRCGMASACTWIWPASGRVGSGRVGQRESRRGSQKPPHLRAAGIRNVKWPALGLVFENGQSLGPAVSGHERSNTHAAVGHEEAQHRSPSQRPAFRIGAGGRHAPGRPASFTRPSGSRCSADGAPERRRTTARRPGREAAGERPTGRPLARR